MTGCPRCTELARLNAEFVQAYEVTSNAMATLQTQIDMFQAQLDIIKTLSSDSELRYKNAQLQLQNDQLRAQLRHYLLLGVPNK